MKKVLELKEGDLLTPEQTARVLTLFKNDDGITPDTAILANWRYEKKGPPYSKIEGKIRYPRHLLNDWVLQNTEDVA